MMNEIISIHIGQAGVKLGSTFWELFCLEHQIEPNGDVQVGDPVPGSFFQEIAPNKFQSRSIFIDSAPTSIDEIRKGTFRELFEAVNLISGQQDSSNNFAKGRYSFGKEMIDSCLDRVRRTAETCANLQGFMMFNSVGGGTGSGFTSLLMESLSDEFGKCNRMNVPIFPSSKTSSARIESFNTTLSMPYLLDHSQVAPILDNEAICDIYNNLLATNEPTLDDFNNLVAQFVSTLTASMRLDSALNVNLAEFTLNYISYPRIHFLISSYAPIISNKKALSEQPTVDDITKQAFDPAHMLTKCNPADGKYTASCLVYRGNVIPKDVGPPFRALKSSGIMQFFDWSPTGFKCGINYQGPTIVKNSRLAQTTRALIMLSNSTSIATMLARIADQFDVSYTDKTLSHVYTSEGMEEGEITGAREDLAALLEDYRQIEDESVEGDDE